VKCSRSAAASKTASAAPAEAAEVQAATKTVSTPKSGADMPVDLRGATKPPGAPAEGPPAAAGKGAGAAPYASGEAHSAANAIKLNKNLASQQQVGEIGSRIAGEGTGVPFRDAERFAGQYGGRPADWVKMSSSSHVAPDGTKFQTHWVQNMSTGQRVEFKTKIAGGAQ